MFGAGSPSFDPTSAFKGLLLEYGHSAFFLSEKAIRSGQLRLGSAKRLYLKGQICAYYQLGLYS